MKTRRTPSAATQAKTDETKAPVPKPTVAEATLIAVSPGNGAENTAPGQDFADLEHYESGPILVPGEWDHDRDHVNLCANSKYLYADPETAPFSHLQKELADNYRMFNSVIDSMLVHYLMFNLKHCRGFVHLLSANEKIEWLMELVATHSTRATYRRSFQHCLAKCLFYERERSRILRDWLRTTEPPFLYELLETSNGLNEAADDLEECLVCTEDFGFEGPYQFHGDTAKKLKCG